MAGLKEEMNAELIFLRWFFASFALRRLGIIAAVFDLDQKAVFLALFLENAQCLLKTVSVI
jgi:hypothetical protein